MQSVEEQYRALLPRLLELHPAATSSRVKATHSEVAHVAHGWYMRCNRGTEAVLQLERIGHQEEAGPIRRSIVEHVVALKWLAAEGNAMSTVLRRGGSYEANRRKAALLDANWTSVDMAQFDAVVADGQNLDRQQDNMLNFKPRCEAYGTPHDLATWLNEVARCHPSWESAVPYIRIENGAVTGVAGPTWQIDQAGFCAIHLFEALYAFHSIFEDAPLDQELDQLYRELMATVVRQRRELGLPDLPDMHTAGQAHDV